MPSSRGHAERIGLLDRWSNRGGVPVDVCPTLPVQTLWTGGVYTMGTVRAPGADAWVRNRLIAGTAALFAIRLILSLVRTGPLVVADEIGYLTNARVLGGGIPGQLERAQYYRGGYSLLLAPLLKLSSDPSVAYHLVLALNAALGASLFGLIYLLLTRAVGIAPRAAVWPALAGALYPAVTVFSQVALSENALLPLKCLWLLAISGVLRASRPRRAAAFGAGLGLCGAALWAVHGRMVVALGLTAVFALWLVARRRSRGAIVAGASTLAALGIGFWGAHELSAYVVQHNYGGHVANELTVRLDALDGFHPLLTAATNFAGGVWYLLVCTFGLAAAVVADTAGAMRRREPAGIAPWLLALTLLLLLVSAGSFPNRTRPDMLVYGRYAEVVAPPMIALGLASLARRRTVPLSFVRLAAVLFGLTALVVVIRLTSTNLGVASRWNIASLPFVTFELGAGVLIGAAAVSGAGAALLWGLAGPGGVRLGALRRLSERSAAAGAAALAACLLFALVIGYDFWNPVLTTQRSVYPSGWTSPEPAASAVRARTVAYDLADYDEIGLYVPQWFLPHTRESLFDSSNQPPPVPFVLSGAGWGRAHPSTHSVVLWHDRGRNQLLWHLH